MSKPKATNGENSVWVHMNINVLLKALFKCPNVGRIQ